MFFSTIFKNEFIAKKQQIQTANLTCVKTACKLKYLALEAIIAQ